MLTGEQLRMARAALRLTVKETAELAGVDKGTIVRIEAGEKSYKRTLRDLRNALENAGLFFIDAKEGFHGAAVAFKWGFEPARFGEGQGATARGRGGEGSLDARGWDWSEAKASDGQEPTPSLSWTDEDRARQIAYWRDKPEKWAALAEVSRQCLLRAMGMERL